MAKTLQIQSKATIKIHFKRKKILTKKSILFLATLGQKYVKFESKLHKNTFIYSEILRKLPLWADFSKSVLQIIVKMVFFSCGGGP
jgi:hypothetical protein